MGRTVLITGANSGIGKATAKEMAKLGYHVIMLCHKSPRTFLTYQLTVK